MGGLSLEAHTEKVKAAKENIQGHLDKIESPDDVRNQVNTAFEKAEISIATLIDELADKEENQAITEMKTEIKTGLATRLQEIRSSLKEQIEKVENYNHITLLQDDISAELHSLADAIAHSEGLKPVAAPEDTSVDADPTAATEITDTPIPESTEIVKLRTKVAELGQKFEAAFDDFITTNYDPQFPITSLSELAFPPKEDGDKHWRKIADTPVATILESNSDEGDWKDVDILNKDYHYLADNIEKGHRQDLLNILKYDWSRLQKTVSSTFEAGPQIPETLTQQLETERESLINIPTLKEGQLPLKDWMVKVGEFFAKVNTLLNLVSEEKPEGNKYQPLIEINDQLTATQEKLAAAEAVVLDETSTTNELGTNATAANAASAEEKQEAPHQPPKLPPEDQILIDRVSGFFGQNSKSGKAFQKLATNPENTAESKLQLEVAQSILARREAKNKMKRLNPDTNTLAEFEALKEAVDTTTDSLKEHGIYLHKTKDLVSHYTDDYQPVTTLKKRAAEEAEKIAREKKKVEKRDANRKTVIKSIQADAPPLLDRWHEAIENSDSVETTTLQTLTKDLADMLSFIEENDQHYGNVAAEADTEGLKNALRDVRSILAEKYAPDQDLVEQSDASYENREVLNQFIISVHEAGPQINKLLEQTADPESNLANVTQQALRLLTNLTLPENQQLDVTTELATTDHQSTILNKLLPSLAKQIEQKEETSNLDDETWESLQSSLDDIYTTLEKNHILAY